MARRFRTAAESRAVKPQRLMKAVGTPVCPGAQHCSPGRAGQGAAGKGKGADMGGIMALQDRLDLATTVRPELRRRMNVLR